MTDELGQAVGKYCEHSRAIGLTFFRSAARGLHVPTARRAASRDARRGSAGPANGRVSAAAKSYAAGVCKEYLQRIGVEMGQSDILASRAFTKAVDYNFNLRGSGFKNEFGTTPMQLHELT